MRTGWRKSVYWALYLVVVGVSGLALAEAGVRMLGLAPRIPNQYRFYTDDPILSHKLLPDTVTEGRAATGEFDFHYAHNSHGLRDREFPTSKPAGTYRILALGDSFTYGAGARFENTFLSRLERALNERDGRRPPIAIIKAGIPRFYPEMERLYLENYGAAFGPDLVMVFFVPNDVIDTYMGTDAIRVLPDGRLVSNYGAELLAQLGPSALWCYEHVQVARIAMRWVLQRRIENDRPARWDQIFVANGFHEDAWREVEHQYEMMVAWARRRGVAIVFVHLPLAGPWDAGSHYPPRRLAAWAERQGVPFIDVLPAMERQDDPARLYWPIDHHPTDEGHAVIADALFGALMRDRLIP